MTYTMEGGEEEEVVGYFTFSVTVFQYAIKNWTQLDLRFCKTGVKKISEKEGQFLESKSRREFIQNP